MNQKVIVSGNLERDLVNAIAECEHDKIFILTDQTTHDMCLPKLQNFLCLKGAQSIVIKAGDTNKTLDSLAEVWTVLSQGGATRHSLMINLGGGMVTDLGGFAASTFKRGIDFINIPTTLLAMVDASVGGDGHQLWRTEERDWRVLRQQVCHHQHTISRYSRPRQYMLGLCRDVEAWSYLGQ